MEWFKVSENPPPENTDVLGFTDEGRFKTFRVCKGKFDTYQTIIWWGIPDIPPITTEEEVIPKKEREKEENMSIELNTGTLYMNDVPLCKINEIPTLTYEPAHESLTEARQIFDVRMSFFSSDITYFNTDLFEQLTASTTAPFKLCAEIPIMIQARWHKKPRIRKKWLKRYGMKPDIVKIEMDIDQLEYTPGEYINECETGIIGTYNSFNFNTNEIRYIFRPDQLWHGIKIEV